MRRVDKPDEPGWWWGLFLGDDRPYPIKFWKDVHGVIRCDSLYENATRFEGPIPEPKMLMRFETEGTIKFIGSKMRDCTSRQVVNIIAGPIPSYAVDKRFKITFEEIL